MKEIIWKSLLVIGLMITLAGCQTLQARTHLPTKPTLHAKKMANGDVCFSKQDASELGSYILELERK